MKAVIGLLLVIAFVGCTSPAQDSLIEETPVSRDSLISSKILAADTIMLVSHSSIKESTLPETMLAEKKLELIIDGRLNPNIVRKKVLVEKNMIDSLIDIFTMKATNDTIGIATGFNPYQSIIFITKNKTSYIAIDYGPGGISTSEDLKFIGQLFPEQRGRLRKFFRKAGIEYTYQ